MGKNIQSIPDGGILTRQHFNMLVREINSILQQDDMVRGANKEFIVDKKNTQPAYFQQTNTIEIPQFSIYGFKHEGDSDKLDSVDVEQITTKNTQVYLTN